MRYCPFCQRWNLERPQRCHYCGHTWGIKLCQAGHENPPDAQFCGTCGSADLSETAGPTPAWLWVIRIIVIGFILLLIISLGNTQFRLTDQIITFIIAITILITALHLSLTILPGPIKRYMMGILKLIKKGTINLLKWCWEKL